MPEAVLFYIIVMGGSGEGLGNLAHVSARARIRRDAGPELRALRAYDRASVESC